jgi:hypothetical protein
MIVCTWPLGCVADVLGDGAFCYWHRKVADGLIEETRRAFSPRELEPIRLPPDLAAEARRRRAAYFEQLEALR